LLVLVILLSLPHKFKIQPTNPGIVVDVYSESNDKNLKDTPISLTKLILLLATIFSILTFSTSEDVANVSTPGSKFNEIWKDHL